MTSACDGAAIARATTVRQRTRTRVDRASCGPAAGPRSTVRERRRSVSRWSVLEPAPPDLPVVAVVGVLVVVQHGDAVVLHVRGDPLDVVILAVGEVRLEVEVEAAEGAL